MTQRRIILGLILFTVVAFGLLAAAKLRATPKYDRLKTGMVWAEVVEIMGTDAQLALGVDFVTLTWINDEGRVEAAFASDPNGEGPLKVCFKSVDERRPLYRLAWIAGWKLEPYDSLPSPPPLPVIAPSVGERRTDREATWER